MTVTTATILFSSTTSTATTPPTTSHMNHTNTPTTSKSTTAALASFGIVGSSGGDGSVVPTSGTYTASNNNNNNETLLLLSLETMNEQLRNLLSKESIQSLLLQVQERSLRMEQLTLQQQEQIQATLQYIQQQQSVLLPEETTDPTPTPHQDATTTKSLSSTAKLNIALQQHEIRRRTLIQHTATSLLELLELPNLMDACIKSSLSTSSSTSSAESSTMNSGNNDYYYYYDEAIQIAAFANTLERRHGGGTNPTIVPLLEVTHYHGDNSETNISRDSNNTRTNPPPEVTPSVNIIHQVITQIRLRQEELRQHLLLRLQQQQPHQSSPHTKPNTNTTTNTTMMMNECLEIITALRRLNAIDLERKTQSSSSAIMNMEQAHAISEYQLQIAFLEARDVWLDSRRSTSNNPINRTHLSPVSHGTIHHTNTNPLLASETILDMIERYRTRMFEIATQYNAIFTTSSASSTTASSTTTTAQQLLSLWITRRIQYFLQMLRRELLLSMSTSNTGTNSNSHSTSNHTSGIDTAMVRDAIEASVFFATSLGRLGGDFTSQLVSIFEPIVIQMITEQYWNPGLQQLHHTLEICRDAGIAGPLSTAALEDNDNDNQNKYDDLPSILPPLDEPQPPPKRLLTLPPLARFVNSILTGLNELRRCLLPGIFITLRQYMKTNVIDVMKQELELNERMVLTPGLLGDAIALRSIAIQMKDTFHLIVEPYILGSLEAAVGYKDGAILYHTQLYSNIQGLQQRSAVDIVEPEKEDIDNSQIDHPSDSIIDNSTTAKYDEDIVLDNVIVNMNDTTSNDDVDSPTDASSAAIPATTEPVVDVQP